MHQFSLDMHRSSTDMRRSNMDMRQIRSYMRRSSKKRQPACENPTVDRLFDYCNNSSASLYGRPSASATAW